MRSLSYKYVCCPYLTFNQFQPIYKTYMNTCKIQILTLLFNEYSFV